MQNFSYVPYEPIVGNIRKNGETVFLAELTISPADFATRVPAGFTIISDTAYVMLTETVLRDEKSKDYAFINPTYTQYYSAGILVEIESQGHRGFTFVTRYFDRDWAVMDSRAKGFDAFHANIRTTRFPTEMRAYYDIQHGSRLKAVAIDEGTKPISLGFDAAVIINTVDFTPLFAKRLGLRQLAQIVQGRTGEPICNDLTHELLTDIKFSDIWQCEHAQLTFDHNAVGSFAYTLRNAYWFMVGYTSQGIALL